MTLSEFSFFSFLVRFFLLPFATFDFAEEFLVGELPGIWMDKGKRRRKPWDQLRPIFLRNWLPLDAEPASL